MILSMTGYGRARQVLNGREITVELRGVNARFLEYSSRLPRAFAFLEDPLKKLVAARVSRGKVELSLTVQNTTAADTVVTVNWPLAKGYRDAMTALSGAVLAQYQKSADINLGTGMVVIGLASLIIGETLFGRGGLWTKAVAAVAGSVIYRFIIALALRANVPAESLKLISAVIVALAIAAPALRDRAAFRRRRAHAEKEGARHA